MSAPRFVFVGGSGRGHGARPLWPGPLYEFEGTPAEDDSWVAWRLTGGNHRELGRSARVFADLELARADALTVHHQIAETETQVLIVPPAAGWGWRVSLDGIDIAASSRAYPRERECMHSVEVFVQAAADAGLSSGPVHRPWQGPLNVTTDPAGIAHTDADNEVNASP